MTTPADHVREVRIKREWDAIDRIKEQALAASGPALAPHFLKLRELYSNNKNGTFEKELERRGYKPRTVRQWITEFQKPGTKAAHDKASREKISGSGEPDISQRFKIQRGDPLADGVTRIDFVLPTEKQKKFDKARDVLGRGIGQVIYEAVIAAAASKPKSKAARAGA
jgi:hypothetical protein